MTSSNEAVAAGLEGCRMRTANLCDARAVRQLDNLSFPLDSPDAQRADPGELETGIEVGDVRVLERDGLIIGYLHADTSFPGRIYVSGLAIDPKEQSRGLGTRLIQACLAGLEPADVATRPIVTVTSPNNHTMLHLLFAHGFVARWALRNFFGADRHRFGMQLRTGRPEGDREPSRLVAAVEVNDVFALLDTSKEVVGGLTRVAGEPHFQMYPYRRHDYPEDLPTLPGVPALSATEKRVR